MTALANRANLAVPVNNANAEIGLLAMWDALNEATEKPELDIASASTCNIGAALSTKLRITGTTTITSFGTVYRGPILIRMAAALTITYNATTMVCPGNANLVTAAGDVLMAWPKTTASGTSDGWQVALLSRASANETIAGNKVFSGSVTPSSTLGIVGTATNDSVNAGGVGEHAFTNVAAGSAIGLVSNTPLNVASVILSAGDWDVYGNILFIPAATTNLTLLQGSTGTVSVTHDAISQFIFPAPSGMVTGATASGFAVPAQRLSIASSTTVYLVATAKFTVSTMAVYGRVWARRAR